MTYFCFKNGKAILALLVILGGLSSPSVAYATKKKVIYKKFTQLDFAGETVEGKIRAPEVFYIFQRKRSKGHRVVETPVNFSHHDSAIQSTLKGALHP